MNRILYISWENPELYNIDPVIAICLTCGKIYIDAFIVRGLSKQSTKGPTPCNHFLGEKCKVGG